MINFYFRLILLLFVLEFEKFGCIVRRKTKLYLVKVKERNSNYINKRQPFHDYKSGDDDHERSFKKLKAEDDSFLNKMRRELGIVKGFFRSSSNTKGNCEYIKIEKV